MSPMHSQDSEGNPGNQVTVASGNLRRARVNIKGGGRFWSARDICRAMGSTRATEIEVMVGSWILAWR